MNSDKKASIERFLENVSHLKENVTFAEAYEFLENVDAALDEVKDQPELQRELTAIRIKLVEKIDVRAKDIGKSGDWEELKKSQLGQRTLDKLQAAESHQAYFDTSRDLTSEEQDALQYLESKGLLDLKKVRRGENLAEAVRQNATGPRLFWAMFRMSPLDATKALFGSIALPLIAILAILVIIGAFVWAGKY